MLHGSLLHIALISFSCCWSLLFALLYSPLRIARVSSSRYSSLFFVLLSFFLCVVLFSFVCCWAFLFALSRSLLCTTLNSSSHCWLFLFVLLYFPLHDVGLFSSCCSTILLMLPNSPSRCSTLLCDATLLFTLLGFPFCIAFLFGYFPISSTRFFMSLFSSLQCCCWCVVICWKILYYPPTFLIAGIRNGWESKIENLYFFNKFFSLCLLSFLLFSISCLLFFCFNYFCFCFVVQGLLQIVLETNINSYTFDNFIFLLTYKCFAISYLCLLVNILHHT